MKQRARGIRFSLIFSIVAMLAAIPTLLISQPASAATYPTYTYGSDGSFTVSGGSLSKFLTSGSFEATYNSSGNTWDADVKAVSGSSCPGDNVSIQIVANNVTEPGVTSTVTEVIAMCSADGSAIKIGSVNYSDGKQYWTDGKVKVVKSSTTTPGGPGSAKPPGIDGEELYRFHTEKDATGKYILACVGMFKQFSGIGAPGTELDGCVEFAEGSAAGEDPLLTWSKTLNVANPSLYGCSGAGSKPYTFTITAENPPTLNETGSVPATLTVKPASSTSNCTDLELKGSLAGIAIEIMDGDDLDSLIGLPFAVSAESKCQVEGGLGWILCPLLNTLASLNDKAWDTVIEDFLIVTPISTDTSKDNGLYQAWIVMRNISNVLFVIAFLFIIYSQITSMGVTNYGVKKMLPRLIIGAILVNTSYWLAAAAIDASNIVGASLFNVLNGIADGIASVPADGAPKNWMAVTALVLAGAVGVAMVGLATLLPLIFSAALLLFGLVVTLAFRHAVLLILVVAAPFAAIAYMMPNTDKISRSWWSLFKLLLILYPLIAFVVGVSTLAGTVIFNAAEGDILLQIVGIAAPALGILGIPMLVKATSGALGRFGLQSPFSGITSAMKNSARDFGGRMDKRRAAYGANKNNNPVGRYIARKTGASRRIRRDYINKQKEQAFDSQIEAGTLGSKAGRKWNQKVGAAQQNLSSVKANVEVEELKANQELHLNAAVDNLRLAGAKEEQEALEKQAMAGVAGEGVTPEVAQAMQAAADEKFIQSLRGDSADREVRSGQFARLNEKEDGDGGEYTQGAQQLQKRAAGIGSKERVVAGAIALADKEKSEAITNRIAMMEDRYKANELVGKAKEDLIKSYEEGDSVGARAAAQVLARNTGSAGITALEEAMQKIDSSRAQATGDTAEKMDSVMEGVKYDLTASSLKGKSRVLDLYSTSKENASFEAIRNDASITSGLNQAELAGQSQNTLMYWAEKNILKPEQAQAVMASYEKGTLPLDDKKKAIFANKAGNMTISHDPTPNSGPRLRGGETTTASGIVIPKDMEQ